MPATLSQIQAWSTEHLIDAAAYWTQTADRWEDAFLTMRNQAHSITWHGAGGDALRERTGSDLSVVSDKADQLRQAAGIARNGASDISAAQRRVLYGVEDAQNAGFTVGEDLSVTDTRSTPPAERATRQAKAQAFAADIRSRAEQLEGAEVKVAGQLTAAAGTVGDVGFAQSSSYNGGQQSPTNGDGQNGRGALAVANGQHGGVHLVTSSRTAARNRLRCRNPPHLKDSRRSGHSPCRHKWPLPHRRHRRPPPHPYPHPHLVWRDQASANA